MFFGWLSSGQEVGTGMKKRALIISTVCGFLWQFERNDVRLLQENGYEIHYASNFGNPVYTYDKNAYDRMGIITHHIPIQKSPGCWKENRKALKVLTEIIKKENIQLIHCHTPMGGVLGRLAGKRAGTGVYVIYTAHGFHFYQGAPRKNWLFYFRAEKFLARMTDGIVTINQEDYENARKFHMKKNGKVYKIPGVGLDLKKFFPRKNKRAEIRMKYSIPEDAFCMVTAANLDPEKNHDTVLKALAQRNDKQIYYVICGNGPEKQSLQDLTKQYGLEGQVYFLGFQEHMEDVLQAADVFVFPSLREGLGMAALEALACGIPVIAADNRGTREYMKNGKNGYLCEGTNVYQYAQAIKKLKENPDLREKMGEAGCETAQRFALSQTELVMRQVYRDAERSVERYEWNTDQYHHGSVQSKSV